MNRKDNVSTGELAAELGVSVVTLAQARGGKANGFSELPFIKIGRRVLYRRVDIENFLEQHLSHAVMPAKEGQ